MVVSLAMPDWSLGADLDYLATNAISAVLAPAAQVADLSGDSNALGETQIRFWSVPVMMLETMPRRVASRGKSWREPASTETPANDDAKSWKTWPYLCHGLLCSIREIGCP